MADEASDIRERALKAVYATDPNTMTAHEMAAVFEQFLLSERTRAKEEQREQTRDECLLAISHHEQAWYALRRALGREA